MEDPPEEAETWPYDRLRALDRSIRDLAWSLVITEPVYVWHVALRSAAAAGIPAETVARARRSAQ